MPGPHPLLEDGEVWKEPRTNGDSFPYYGVFRDVSTGRPTGDFHVTFRDAGEAQRDLRLWMTADGASTLFVGRSPNPGRTNNAMNLYTHWRPSLLVRNRVAAGTLQSLYAAVIEPMPGGPPRSVPSHACRSPIPRSKPWRCASPSCMGGSTPT